jgi:hypothetical protein
MDDKGRKAMERAGTRDTIDGSRNGLYPPQFSENRRLTRVFAASDPFFLLSAKMAQSQESAISSIKSYFWATFQCQWLAK